MKYLFLFDRKPNPNSMHWSIYFSSILIQMKVIAQTLGIDKVS